MASHSAKLPSLSPACDLILTLSKLVEKTQSRAKVRLVDHDDIGEFVAEIIKLRSSHPGQFVALHFLAACESRKASSYKGRMESTILRWSRDLDNTGQDKLEVLRIEKMSAYRFRAYLSLDTPPDACPGGYKWQRSTNYFNQGMPCVK